jgi:hypothetical protein
LGLRVLGFKGSSEMIKTTISFTLGPSDPFVSYWTGRLSSGDGEFEAPFNGEVPLE